MVELEGQIVFPPVFRFHTATYLQFNVCNEQKFYIERTSLARIALITFKKLRHDINEFL